MQARWQARWQTPLACARPSSLLTGQASGVRRGPQGRLRDRRRVLGRRRQLSRAIFVRPRFSKDFIRKRKSPQGGLKQETFIADIPSYPSRGTGRAVAL